MLRRSSARSGALASAALVVVAAALLAAAPRADASQAPGYPWPKDDTRINYREVLAATLKFYEAQASGTFPTWSSLHKDNGGWRGDSHLDDGLAVDVDLSGGLYNDGGHLKTTIAMANFAAIVAHSAVLWPQAYTPGLVNVESPKEVPTPTDRRRSLLVDPKSTPAPEEESLWPATYNVLEIVYEYFNKSTVAFGGQLPDYSTKFEGKFPEAFVAQVGDADRERSWYWGRPETDPLMGLYYENIVRSVHTINSSGLWA